jgi:hypothetical protein
MALAQQADDGQLDRLPFADHDEFQVFDQTFAE